jgi:TonB family protein
VARPDLNGGRQRLGYFAAISASALVHAGLVVLLLFVLPQLLRVNRVEPPAYTVQILNNLPAGDLGTHPLPPLSHKKITRREPPPEREKPESTIIPPRETESDSNAIALNEQRATATPTATPPPPPPEPTPTATPHPRRTPRATPRPTPRPHRPRPTPLPTTIARRHRERKPPKAVPKPSVMIVEAEPTPDLSKQLAEVHEELENESKKIPPARSTPEKEGGPVEASKASSGTGYGVGPGTGSAGIQKDPEFLLYYETIRKRIKDAWSFPGANNDLSTEVLFAIGQNGELNGVKVLESSRDAAFDDSVVRAIRRAAPFPPPPEKYRSQFEQGVEAEFKPGELQS